MNTVTESGVITASHVLAYVSAFRPCLLLPGKGSDVGDESFDLIRF
jgi:hypothetical protein